MSARKPPSRPLERALWNLVHAQADNVAQLHADGAKRAQIQRLLGTLKMVMKRHA